jgi:hypothetical protein
MHELRTRLGAYVVVLVGLFATGFGIGARFDEGDGGGHRHGGPRTWGLTATVDGYALDLDPSLDGSLLFRITRDGAVVTDFDEVHQRRLHLLAARDDLSQFLHLHPEMDDEGTWRTSLPGPGTWRVVAEAQPSGTGNLYALGTEVAVEGSAATSVLPEPDDVVTVPSSYGDLEVRRLGWDFRVTPTDHLTEYLGAPAHLVAFRVDDLSMVHLHASSPSSGRFQFAAELPGSGTYRMWLEFGVGDDVATAAFTVVI